MSPLTNPNFLSASIKTFAALFLIVSALACTSLPADVSVSVGNRKSFNASITFSASDPFALPLLIACLNVSSKSLNATRFACPRADSSVAFKAFISATTLSGNSPRNLSLGAMNPTAPPRPKRPLSFSAFSTTLLNPFPTA